MTRQPLLLIEDTASLRMVYVSILRHDGHEVESAATAEEGWRAFQRLKPKVVLLDLMLPDRDGLDLMGQMLRERPETNVVVITANGSISKAVEAMRVGAHDFIVKPVDEARLLGAVHNAIDSRSPTATAAPGAPELGEMMGASAPMRAVFAKVASVARSMATVFITGESGTGKELCALAVHNSSNRAGGPFIALNCGAIPHDLLESEVFDHLKGAFTGAIADKPGAAAAADGGTLFLDEVCELDLNLQTKLLRFLQTSMIQPVGASRPRKVNVRIICATNRDPLDEVRRGRFREDLYYRLHVVPIHMPPLRERGDDILAIAGHALLRYAQEEGRNFDSIDPEVAALFRTLHWPGNVRQLLNVIRHAVVLHEGPVLRPDMLPAELHGPGAFQSEPGPAPAATAPAAAPPLQLDGILGKTLAEIERLVIEETIARNGGSVPRAARVLDVSPSTLYRKRESWAQTAAGGEAPPGMAADS